MDIHRKVFAMGTCDASGLSDIKVSVTEKMCTEVNRVDFSWWLLELKMDGWRIFTSCV